jgi:CRP-like cAMP-binding protein
LPFFISFVDNALDQNFIFATLGEDERVILLNAMEKVDIGPNENIITQGEEGDYFYIIERGTFTVLVNDSPVATLTDGKSFGELALLYNTPRQATIRSQGPAQLFSLDRDTFRYTLAKSSSERSHHIQHALARVPLLSGLTPLQLSKISEAVEIVKFQAGQSVFKKGSEGNIFYMIKEGSVRVSEVGSGAFNDHTLTAGAYFGERALITGEPRAANVVAESACVLMALDLESFNSLLGPLREVLDHNLNMRVLENIKLFSNLTERERSKVSRSFEFETFPAGTTIIREGDRGRKFYILKEGTAKVMIGGEEVGQLESGNYFGEMALLDDEVRKASVLATAACECFVLDRPTFNRILGSLQDILARETQQRLTILNEKAGAPEVVDIQFKDLQTLTVLGAGTFGRVSLVQHKTTKEVYALKALIKAEVVMHKQQANVVQEKDVMIQSNHPFILRLYTTFKDATKLYMLLEFVQGGELFSVIHTARSDGVSPASAKFYGAGVLLGLAYLHSKDIAYRDMKPENCLVDKDGYPKVVDFGFAKVIKNTKTYTLCGTPEYLAPEIVLGRGHDKSVDYWAFGILLYEMIAGYSPFSDPQVTNQVLTQAVVIFSCLTLVLLLFVVCLLLRREWTKLSFVATSSMGNLSFQETLIQSAR